MGKKPFVREFQGKQRLKNGRVIDVWGRETQSSMILSNRPMNGPYAMICEECSGMFGEWSTSEKYVREQALKAGWKQTATGYRHSKCKPNAN